MGEYFRVWKRKIGVVALVVACAFMGLWMRSLSSIDTLMPYAARNRARCFYQVRSERSAIKFVRFQGTDEFTLRPLKFFFSSPIRPSDRTLSVECRRQICGFEFREGLYGGGEIKETDYVLPYWAIVFSTTLVSACFLLSKSQPTVFGQSPITTVN